jgi:hypothetical protein
VVSCLYLLADAAVAREWDWDSRPAVSAAQNAKQQQQQRGAGTSGANSQLPELPSTAAGGRRQLHPLSSVSIVASNGGDALPSEMRLPPYTRAGGTFGWAAHDSTPQGVVS